MAKEKSMLALVMSVFFFVTVQTVEAPVTPTIFNCVVEITGNQVKGICSHLNLVSVPQNLPVDLTELLLNDNKLTSLYNVSFDRYHSLQQLNISNNQICHIESGAFESLTELTVLELDNNEISEIPNSLFAGNVQLAIVSLSNNKLTCIPNTALHRIRNLQSIILSGNLIEKLNFTAFSDWDVMQTIDLSRNNITVIHQRDFEHLRNCSVHELNLSFNALTELPVEAFMYLEKVQNLYLDSTNLHQFVAESFMGSMKFEELSLKKSKISEIVPVPKEYIQSSSLTSLVQTISLAHNVITAIPTAAFCGFKKLATLDLESNAISSINNSSFCGLGSLTCLILSMNKITQLPPNAFECVPMLRTLTLSDNSLMKLDIDWFMSVPSLTHLDVSQNSILSIETGPWKTTALTYLDLSMNNIDTIHGATFAGLTNLKVLNISDNYRGLLSGHALRGLSELEVLNSSNIGGFTLNNSFGCMDHLVELDLSSITSLHIASVREFTKTSALINLKMSHGNLIAADLVSMKDNASLFQDLTALSTLNLEYNNLSDVNNAPWIFAPLRRLTVLNLKHNNIVALQSAVFWNLTSLRELNLDANWIVMISENAFSYLQNLQILYLEYNQVEDIKKELFAGAPNLTVLYLQGNQITTILPNTILPKGMVEFDLHGNPLTCICQLSWFMKWLHDSSTNLKYPHLTKCSTASFQKLVDQPIESFNPDEFCSFNIAKITGITITVVAVVFIGVLVYNKRWWFNYKWFLLKLAVFGYTEIEQAHNSAADNFPYQLNVMFHDDDKEWVNRIMKPGLEERMPRLERIIFGDQDLNLGMYLVNALHHAIENSFKTVLLLSNHCVDDSWFMTKLRMALEHINDTKLDKVILVFLEDIGDANLPYLVRLFLSKNKPYLLWTDDEDGQELFWAQFEKCMRVNRVINNIIPV